MAKTRESLHAVARKNLKATEIYNNRHAKILYGSFFSKQISDLGGLLK